MIEIDVLPYYKDNKVELFCGDSLEILPKMEDETFDMVFVDPPYLLSNGGITCKSGKMVSVNKGDWDKPKGIETDHEFSVRWLKECRRVLKKNGTIWVSGTSHIIYSVGYAMQKLGYKILNDIIWFKRNAPPNLSCRYFTHSTETILWAAKSEDSKHTFNYEEMKAIDNSPFDDSGKQMRNVWNILSPRKEEKKYGKHPTQKPLKLLNRIIRASTNEGDLILDAFIGSGTTAVSAMRNNRKCIGIDFEEKYLEIAVKRVKSDT